MRVHMHNSDIAENCVPKERFYSEYTLCMLTDMPPGTDCPYPIRILAFFEMIRPYHVVIRI